MYKKSTKLNPPYKQTGRKKKSLIISLYAPPQKKIEEMQHPFILKVLEKARIQGASLNKIKALYIYPIASIKLKWRET